MKKLTFLFFFVILFSVSVFAQNNPSTRADEKLPDGTPTDRCTFFPDGDYFDCCNQHDITYFTGGTGKERSQADKALYKCVKSKKGFYHKIVAPMMFVGIRIGGVSWLPTPFRWGFGRKKLKKNE